LYAISQLGTPAEIVSLYARIMGDLQLTRRNIEDVLFICYTCMEGDAQIIGNIVPTQRPKFGTSSVRFKPGPVPIENAVHIARSLLRHGVTGALPPLPQKPGEEPATYTDEFDARANVSLAIAHLGASSEQAWQMTMTELVGALRAKFPPLESTGPGAKAPTREDHDQAMEWFAGVEAAMKQRT
jgi:hypothetical protein